MACYHPSDVPVRRKTPVGRIADTVTVPCGHCLGCRTDQARDWAIRITHESQIRGPSWFATLTYSDDTLPAYGSLDPKEPAKFIKRLRRRTPSQRFSYYLVGEYGDASDRPHLHAALLGLRCSDRELATHRPGDSVYQSDTLTEAWGHGIAEISALSYESAAYIAGYVRKKLRSRDDPEFYTRVDPSNGVLHDLVPEYARMSLRPAIGKEWLEKYWTDVYPRDFVVMNGHELKPPRFYDRWMDIHQPHVMMAVREQRYEDAVEIGDEKLIMKEKIHRARVAVFSKRNKI